MSAIMSTCSTQTPNSSCVFLVENYSTFLIRMILTCYLSAKKEAKIMNQSIIDYH